MYKRQTVFSQIMDFLPISKFRRCVDRYNGNYRVRSFTCFDQLLCMAFAQLTAPGFCNKIYNRFKNSGISNTTSYCGSEYN